MEDGQPPPFQFGLRTLLVLPILVIVFFAIAGAMNVFAAIALTIPIGLLLACFHPQMRRWAPGVLVVYLLFVGCLGQLLPARSSAPEAHPRVCCTNSLKQLALALHNYHDIYGSFPPAYVADDHGRPLHSWRVLILPFMEEEALYKDFRLDEPWDSPHNLKLADAMPIIYRCRSDPSSTWPCTSYVAVIGAETAWPGATAVSFSDFTDGSSNTLLLVEVENSGILWTEPRDLRVDKMAPTLNSSVGQGVSSNHPGGVNVALADGSVQFLSDTLTAEQLRALLTIDGGEPTDFEW